MDPLTLHTDSAMAHPRVSTNHSVPTSPTSSMDVDTEQDGPAGLATSRHADNSVAMDPVIPPTNIPLTPSEGATHYAPSAYVQTSNGQDGVSNASGAMSGVEEGETEISENEIAENNRMQEEGRNEMFLKAQNPIKLPRTVQEMYESMYPTFRFHWIAGMREKTRPKLESLRSKIDQEASGSPVHIGKWDKVTDFMSKIETLSSAWSDWGNNPRDIQFEAALRNDLVSFVTSVAHLGLNVAAMSPKRHQNEAIRLFEESDQDADESGTQAMLGLLKNAVQLPRSIIITEQVTSETTRHALGQLRRLPKSEVKSVLEVINDVNAFIRNKNTQDGYTEFDHALPLSELTDAMKYDAGPSRDDELSYAFQIMASEGYPCEGFVQELPSAAKPLHQAHIRQLVYLGGVSEDSDAPRQDEQREDILNQDLQTSALNDTSAPLHNAHGYNDEQIPVAPGKIEEGFTSCGKISHVRKLGGRNGGFRVIVNTGTDRTPLYECIPGAELGRGEAARFEQETPTPILKDRLRRHVERALHMVEVQRQYVRINKQGNVTAPNRAPITYFMMKWTEEGRLGNFQGTPNEQWLTRSELLQFCGKRDVESWRRFLTKKNADNTKFLNFCRKCRLHPATQKPLSKKEIQEFPWLIDYKEEDSEKRSRQSQKKPHVRRPRPNRGRKQILDIEEESEEEQVFTYLSEDEAELIGRGYNDSSI